MCEGSKNNVRVHSIKPWLGTCEKASLTVEAAFVLPIFTYLMLVFLYFIQIFMLQEEIQSAITTMGQSLAKGSYIFEDFTDTEETQSFDQSVLGMEEDIGLRDFAKSVEDSTLLKLYVQKYLNADDINRSCIQNGFEGISFMFSKVMDSEDCIDVIARYRVDIPIKLFPIETMRMIQRVRLRAWTGHQVPARYRMVEQGEDTNDPIVFITDTGRVYHIDRNCSHIKLAITSVIGIPSGLRNDNGAKYYPCEACCNGTEDRITTYYITTDGTRYHTEINCPKLKRTLKEVHLSEVQGMPPCKRCGK